MLRSEPRPLDPSRRDRMVLLVRLARDPQVMGDQVISRRLALAGGAVAVLAGGFGLLFIII